MNLFLSWDGKEYKSILNDDGEDLTTTYSHNYGEIARYEDQPIAIAGKDTFNTEIYNRETNSWESQSEWGLDFLKNTYPGAKELYEFSILSFENYIVAIGGRYHHANHRSLSSIIGSAYDNLSMINFRYRFRTYYDDLKAKFENRSWTEIGRLLIPRGWGRQSFSAGYINNKFIILGGADTFTQELFQDVSGFLFKLKFSFKFKFLTPMETSNGTF